MFRHTIIALSLTLAACEQRTDFDACVDYWSNVIEQQGITDKKSEQELIYYTVRTECRLSK
ncbi:hypothetical protein TUMSATVNIG1_60510 (plasmid) [Vibrio nigripulchritudo]|uniref:hypothetical protein n=1 Tax=Vibrio nigripulchritudo TaxID=28173 RepID=UPI0019099C6C|nr:hypothetical protein [Vibrio nigripulchritudo]BCL69703.1 hypothetical protein VNTUMSATTG_16400 [Vibrio nigripulchritudo]BCL73748.1 hypothetical protein VNTUMSATTG_56850 [Vibrio nigripulchritudo]BCL74066.1 hypothetical protein VNTUMSATTG_60030 [Vibrio nigripulchritudo]BDU31050.1 hypothetical protein TUMSATVNIG1_16590 [Vibrio nigripulchritudo]BDU35124.1 hypothetical protein TUMSATVNIG1_57330 [Vibrio nigripulchritudo]